VRCSGDCQSTPGVNPVRLPAFRVNYQTSTLHLLIKVHYQSVLSLFGTWFTCAMWKKVRRGITAKLLLMYPFSGTECHVLKCIHGKPSKTHSNKSPCSSHRTYRNHTVYQSTISKTKPNLEPVRSLSQRRTLFFPIARVVCKQHRFTQPDRNCIANHDA